MSSQISGKIDLIKKSILCLPRKTRPDYPDRPDYPNTPVLDRKGQRATAGTKRGR